MNPEQEKTVNELLAEGFEIIPTASDMILVNRGADSRFVRQDGSQMRARAGVSNATVNRRWA